MRVFGRVFRGLAVLFCAGLMFMAVPAAAQTAGSGLGRVAEFLPPSGRDGAWRYSNTGDRFEIENVGDPQAIQYFYVGPADGTEGRRTIEAGVNVRSGTGSAGILYGLDQAGTVYHLLTLDTGGTVTLFRRDRSGFRPMIQKSSSAFRPGAVNTLAIRESGNGIGFSLNGASLGSVEGSLYGAGAVGIAAVGDVRAVFDRFSDTGTDGPGRDRTNVGPTPPLPPPPPPSPALQMRPVRIVDTQGPAPGMVAYQTFVPEGWTTQGGVKWLQQDGPQGCFTGARLIWGAGTPDEAYGLVFLDPLSWGASTIGPVSYLCRQLDLTDAEAVMRVYFNGLSDVMQVTIKEVQRPPELKPTTDAFARSWQTGIPGTRAWADGVAITARVKTATRENDAYFLVWTRHLEARYDSNTMFRTGRTALVLGVFTPVGQLEAGHPGFSTILNNLRVNPQWQQVEAQWWNQKLRQSRPRSGGGGGTGAQTSVGDMMFDSWKRRQGMQDAGQSSSINGIWEVQPWQTPTGSTVLLNQNYNYAWELQNGSVVMTNDANFSPMETYGQTGAELSRPN